MNGWDQWDDPVIALTLFVHRYERILPHAPYDAERNAVLEAERVAWRERFIRRTALRNPLAKADPIPNAMPRLCRWCGTDAFLPGRRSFCSPECRDEMGVRQNPTYARHLVRRRDKFTCALCGEKGRECDHIVPVSEGGGSCGVDNLRILCGQCHGRETGELRKRLNAAARDEAEEARGQTVFRLDP